MTYTCPICGKRYLSPVDMAKCATKCANDIENSRAVKEAEMEVKDAYTKLLNAIANYQNVGGKNKYEASLKIGSAASCRIYGDTFTKDVNLDNAKVTFAEATPFKGKTDKVNRVDKFTSDLEEFCKKNCNISDPKTRIFDDTGRGLTLCQLIDGLEELNALADKADRGDRAAQKTLDEIFEKALGDIFA